MMYSDFPTGVPKMMMPCSSSGRLLSPIHTMASGVDAKLAEVPRLEGQFKSDMRRLFTEHLAKLVKIFDGIIGRLFLIAPRQAVLQRG